MGYTTKFKGAFAIVNAEGKKAKLTEYQTYYLAAFAYTRRVKRDEQLVQKKEDSLRLTVGLPIGKDGGYYVGSRVDGNFGQKPDDNSILAYNSPPEDQPSLWCQWTPNEDGSKILWDKGEKFYNYIEWLNYLLEHFLKPWGYRLKGTVTWQGESRSDRGIICADVEGISSETKE